MLELRGGSYATWPAVCATRLRAQIRRQSVALSRRKGRHAELGAPRLRCLRRPPRARHDATTAPARRAL
eukprot:3995758-Alexandrium_andersonii.AAC.1